MDVRSEQANLIGVFIDNGDGWTVYGSGSAALLAAIAALAAGDTLHIPPDTYTGIDGGSANVGLAIPSNVTILGAGMGATILTATTVLGGIFDLEGTSNVTIKDVGFAGSLVGNAIHVDSVVDCTIEACQFVLTNAMVAIADTTAGAASGTIDGLRITGCVSSANVNLTASGNLGVTITECTFRNEVSVAADGAMVANNTFVVDAAVVSAPALTIITATNCTVANNTLSFLNNDAPGNSANTGVNLVASQNCTIEGNTITGAWYGVKAISDATATSKYLSISANSITDCRDDGIRVGMQHVAIVGNTISNCDYSGVFVEGDNANEVAEHVLIHDNYIVDCGQRPHDEVLVVGGITCGSGPPILFKPDTDDVSIRGNVVRAVDYTPAYGDQDVDFPISAVDQGADTFTFTWSVLQDASSRFPDGGKFEVNGSTGNDAEYTVSAGGASYSGSGVMVITVDEEIPNAVADGNVRLKHATAAVVLTTAAAANTFIKNNDFRNYGSHDTDVEDNGTGTAEAGNDS